MAQAQRVRDPERTRAAIIESVLASFAEGDYWPTSKDLAARAGVSARSVFVHFADLGSLAEAAARRQAERWMAFAAPVPREWPLERRVEALLGQRARMYELMTPVRRGGLVRESGIARLHAAMAEGDRWFRNDAAEVFAPELAADAEAAKPGGLLDAVDAATSWAAWDHLRSRRELTKAGAQRAMARMVMGLLG